MQTSTIKKIDRGIKEYPLIGSQLGIWVGDQVADNKNVFTVAQYIEIQGFVDPNLLSRAIKLGLSEADTIHSQYQNSEHGPIQFVPDHTSPEDIVAPEVIDLSNCGLSIQEAHDKAQKIMRDDIDNELNINIESLINDLSDADTAEPLYRHTLIKLPSGSNPSKPNTEQWFWYQRYHHLMVDGFSFTAITKRITAIYNALLSNNEVTESPFKPFASVVEEYTKYQGSSKQEKDKAFWLEYASNLVAPLSLSYAYASRTSKTQLNNQVFRSKFDINNQQLADINQHPSCQSLTQADLLMSVVMTYLSKMTGSEQVAIGFPFMRRMGSKALRSTGSVVNVLPLQVNISKGSTLAQTAEKLLQEIRLLRRHQRYESEQIQRDAGLVGKEQNLFGPTINCKLFDYKLDFSGNRGITHQLATGPIDDLEFAIYLAENHASIEIAANSSLYTKDDIELHIDRIQYLIQQLSENADTELQNLSSLSPHEKQRIRQWSTGPSIDVSGYGETILDQFYKQVAEQPHEIALNFSSQQLTYQQLSDRVENLAKRIWQYLPDNKGKQSPVVAVALPRCSESIISILAILRLGAIYLPIDLSHPKSRIAIMCEDAVPEVIITDSNGLQSLPANSRTISIDDAVSQSIASDSIGYNFFPEDAAYLFFTSGSTGRPKGVQVPHSAIFNLLVSLDKTIFQQLPKTKHLPENKRPSRLNVALTGSLSFDTSWDPILLMLLGHPLYLYPEDIKQDSQALIEAINTDKIDTLALAPSLATQLMDAGLMEPHNHHPVLMDICGEAVTPDLWNKLQKHPNLSAYNIYGPTEFTVYATFAKVTEDISQPTIGHPLPNTEVYVLDQNLEQVPIGQQGELYLAGDNMTLGYIGRPATTATRFVANPFKPGELMYLTGDIVRWNTQGSLDFIGRADNQVKVRGFRVELGEIETAMTSIPRVKEAAVIVQKIASGNRLLAYCTINSKSTTDVETASGTIEQELHNQLPNYMVPSVVTVLENFPLTVSGKLDRKSLPLPEVSKSEQKHWPQTDEEQLMCNVIGDVLQIEQVALNDDFFNLAGDSISAMQLSTQLRKLGYQLKPADIFSQRTASKMLQAMQFIDQPNTLTAASEKNKAVIDFQTEEQKDQLKQIHGDDVEFLPTLPLQSGLLFHSQLNKDSDNYSFNTRIDLKGTLNVERMQKALSLVLIKYPQLAASFDVQTTGVPIQVIPNSKEQNLSWPCSEYDLSHLPKEKKQQSLEKLEMAEAFRAFDTSTDINTNKNTDRNILAHATYIKLSDHRSVLLLTAHHLIIDGWSTPILLDDLFDAYSNLSLNSPRVSYSSVMNKLSSQEQTGAREAWKGYLDKVTPTLAYPEPQQPDTIYEKHIPIKSSLLSELNQLCRQQGLTLNTIIQTTWALLLSSMTGKNDVVFGSPVSGRFSSVDGIEEHIGLFSNTIPVRINFNGNKTVLEQLKKVQQQQVEMLEHDGLGLGEIQNLAKADTLFDTLLVVENYPAGSELFGKTHHGVKLQNVKNRGYTHYPLTILVLPDETPRVLFEYRDSVSNPEHLIQRFFLILEQITKTPELPLAQLKLLNIQEKQFLDQINQTSHTVSGLTLQQRLSQQAQATPDAVALVDSSNEFTYQSMRQKVEAISYGIQQKNVQPGDIVAVALSRSVNLSLALQSIIHAGAAYLPLDVSYPDERLQFMLEDAAPRVLITDAEHCERLSDLLTTDQETDYKKTVLLHIDELLTASDLPTVTTSESLVSGDDPAYMIYTSGSTGRPKGVLISHHAIVNRLEWMQHQYPVGAGDVVLQKTPASFDVSVWEFFWPLIEGATLVMAPPESHKDPEHLLQLINHYQVTTLHFVPSMLSAFVSNLSRQEKKQHAASLKQVFCSGEALSTELTQNYHQYIDAPLHNLYGPTEAAIDVSYCPALEHMKDNQSGIPIGKPVWNTQLRVLDHYLREVGIGVPGELYLAGEQLALEYYNRAGLTAVRFVANPFADGQKMYRTGDVVRWLDNGQIEYLGRTDDQLKIRGQRIEIGEIEKALLNLEGVKDSAVHARALNKASSQVIDGDNRQLVGYIIPDHEELLSNAGTSGAETLKVEASQKFVNSLLLQLKEQLPAYMVPTTLIIVEEFPLSANGKLDRKSLPDPDQEATQSGRQPETAMESIIADTYAGLLGLDVVYAEGDFFMLGGHSLLAMQLAAELSTKLELPVSVGQVMVSPTVEELAKILSDEELRNDPEKAGLGHVFPIRQGKGIPLFCINPGSGFSWQYTGFPKYLEGDWPIIGLQSPRPDGAVAVSNDMEAAVDMYFAQMKKIQPQGPYHFLGYSFGGTVAAALAARLESQGEEVNFLGLLDTYPPEGQEWRRPTEEEAMEEVEREKEQFLAAAQGEFTDNASLEQQNKMFNDIVANYDDTVRLLSNAESSPYHGKATIFVAENSLPEGWSVSGSWQPFIKQLEQHRLDFSHDNLMAPESLKTLGPLVNQLLQDVSSLTQQKQ